MSTRYNRVLKPNYSKFIEQAMRNLGYTTVDGINELVDNSIDAGASQIDIITKECKSIKNTVESIFIHDNGKGMCKDALEESLRLGSGRDYADNELGEFGCGMITGAISLARRLEIFTSTKNHSGIYYARLDIDDMIAKEDYIVSFESFSLKELKTLNAGETAYNIALSKNSGTIIRLTNLDRVKEKRDALKRNLTKDLSEIYRYKLGKDLEITIDKNKVTPQDFMNWGDVQAVNEGKPNKGTLSLSGLDNEGILEEVFTDPDTKKKYSFSWRSTFQPPRTEGSGGGPKRGRKGKQGICIIRNGRQIISGMSFGLYRKTTNLTGWNTEIFLDTEAASELVGITFTKNRTTKSNSFLNEAFSKYVKENIMDRSKTIINNHCKKKSTDETKELEEGAQRHANNLREISKLLCGLPDQQKKEKVDSVRTTGDNAKKAKGKSPSKKPSLKRTDLDFDVRFVKWGSNGQAFGFATEDRKSILVQVLQLNTDNEWIAKYLTGTERDLPVLDLLWLFALTDQMLIDDNPDIFIYANQQKNEALAKNLNVCASRRL